MNDGVVRSGTFDYLLDLQEIADLAGVGANAVSNWMHRLSDFPTPAIDKGVRRAHLWYRSDILVWLRETGRMDAQGNPVAAPTGVAGMERRSARRQNQKTEQVQMLGLATSITEIMERDSTGVFAGVLTVVDFEVIETSTGVWCPYEGGFFDDSQDLNNHFGYDCEESEWHERATMVVYSEGARK